MTPTASYVYAYVFMSGAVTAEAIRRLRDSVHLNRQLYVGAAGVCSAGAAAAALAVSSSRQAYLVVDGNMRRELLLPVGF